MKGGMLLCNQKGDMLIFFSECLFSAERSKKGAMLMFQQKVAMPIFSGERLLRIRNITKTQEGACYLSWRIPFVQQQSKRRGEC